MSFGCIAGDVADLTRAGESDDHRVFLGSSCRSPLHGWIPMAADGSVDRWRRFFACRIHPQAGLRWDSLRSPFVAKILCLRPGAARRSPSARVSRLRLCFVVPAVTDIVTWRRPQNMLVQTNRAGGAAALPVSVVFRQHHCRLSNDANWFRLGAFFFGSADPDSSGRGFRAGFSRLSGTRWSIAGVGSNQHRG